MRRHLIIGALAAGLFVGACGGGTAAPEPAAKQDTVDIAPPVAASDDSPVTEPAEEITFPARSQATAWEKATAGIGDDGEIDVDTALAAFAATFGDLPGVDTPETTGDGMVPTSGTAALSWLSRHQDELTAEQVAAVRAAVGGPIEEVEPDIAPANTDGRVGAVVVNARAARSDSRLGALFDVSCAVGIDYLGSDGPGTEQYRGIIEEEIGKVGAFLGETLTVPVYVRMSPPRPGKETIAWLAPQARLCNSQTAASCQMGLVNDRVATASAVDVRQAIAHELVHCFQATWTVVNTSLQKPAWLAEGFAEFVSHSVNPGANTTNFRGYFVDFATPLFARTYDAQGFYFHLDDIGVDVVARFKPAYLKDAPVAAFSHLIGGAGAAFADTWASAMTMQPERGGEWYMPSAPAEANPFIPQAFLQNGKTLNVSLGVAQTKAVAISVEADVVFVAAEATKHGRVGWDGFGDTALTELNPAGYCNAPGGCECPDGSRSVDEDLPSDHMLATASGLTEDASVVLRGQSLDDFCKREKKKEAPEAPLMDPCLVGAWRTEEWSMPALVGRAVGGEGAEVDIDKDGNVAWRFDDMTPLRSVDPMLGVVTLEDTAGSSTGVAEAAGGDWLVIEAEYGKIHGRLIDNVLGTMPLPAAGPGEMILLRDGSYDCDRGKFSFTTPDPVHGRPVTIDFEERKG